ncbi:transcription factor of MBF1-like protein [Salinarchaeum sp. Harcht-Bsk1]|uniref:helix-turn-helix domain-containing protein n=1 Tax=Salinarchaeum sp. Harcht-Bsk1 TaxID=1333523 RepID=UPI0003423DF5|nr:multiprotein-bridging factor 1 family protein [Salinarchaeum sp. Harcht-Bsk1]AGN01995.1 transcription factor of MBF1-like protein [Salinarchaeum sp. Harcht-Bsk1]
MAKYSTGGSSGSGDGDACELCGAETDALREANVAGAQLLVCRDCAPHDDAAKTESRTGGGQDAGGSDDDQEIDRTRRAVQNTAKANDVWDGDSSHWEEEGTDYDDDPLPYLVSGYGEALTEARQEAGLQREELGEEMGIDESTLLAIEQGRATQAGVPGSVVEALEERLDVELSEQ